MSTEKLTAVEFLMREFQEVGYISLATYSQAKEMEKKQIILAHGIKDIGVNNMKCVTGEQYYNETFKSE